MIYIVSRFKITLCRNISIANSSDLRRFSKLSWNSSIVVPWMHSLVGDLWHVSLANSPTNKFLTLKFRISLIGRIVILNAFGYLGILRSHSDNAEPVFPSNLVISLATFMSPPCDCKKIFVQLCCFLFYFNLKIQVLFLFVFIFAN